MSKWTYFHDDEIRGLNDALIEKLEKARELSGIPIVITSGLRSLEENQSATGIEDSSHLTGLAVDFKCSESVARFIMVLSLLEAGFKRIGIYDKHIHCDIDETKPQDVIWVGVSH